jgi:two-component SAPR family response regulator
MQGKYEDAVLVLEEGLQDAHQSVNTRVEALLLASLGDVYTDVAEFETAGQAYQHAGEIADALGDRFISNYLALARVLLALRAGDRAGAAGLLKNAESTVQAVESNYERGLLNLARGQSLLTDGQPAEAAAALGQAEDCFVQDGRELENMTSRVWLSAALFQNGDNTLALEKLLSALASFKQVSHSLTIALHQIHPWLQAMQSDPEIRPALKGHASLLQQVGAFEERLPSIRRRLRRLSRRVEGPAPGLMVQAFGAVQVKAGGRLLTMSDWLTQSVRDLFFFFFTAERPLTKEEVAEALWLDMDDPAKLKLRFKNEMYRLRRAVGKNVILFEGEYYRFNHALDYEYDVEAFETHLAQARAATDAEQRIGHYVRAVNLVQGPYLADMDLASAAPERERLAQDFLLALGELGELYLQARKPEKTLEVCQRALSEDPARESVHQLAMRTYAILGDRSAVVRQYKACERALKSEFNLPPSAETDRLYRQLASGHD